MFKLFILAALCAVTVSNAGHLSVSPLVYSAPTYHHVPAYGDSVGSVVRSIPISVSHPVISHVHSSANYVQPIITPVVRATYALPSYTTYAAAPVVHRYNVAPIYKSYVAPSYHTAYSQWRK